MSDVAATPQDAAAARPSLRTHVTGMVVGGALGLVGVIEAALLSRQDAFIFLGVLLGGIGSVYLGFAIADGRTSAIAVQIASAVVFVNVAFVGVAQESAVLLGLGYLGHAAWDAVHHEGHGPTRVRTRYPPFCVVADVVLAALVRGRDLAAMPSTVVNAFAVPPMPDEPRTAGTRAQ